MIQSSIADGTELGKYKLLARLAKGGMAEIYLARATGIEGFEKLVVLKRILPELATDADFIRMFLEEARLTATLDHPNIAHVYDIGRVAGEYFFTMEYIHGEDLRNVLRAAQSKQKPLPLEHSLCIVQGVAAGLHYAHERIGFDGKPLALVHRDVSPSNVLVRYDGCVKVVDFGIAKATARPGVTRSGTLRGKICYMSPEQCVGAPLDRRSDVFALGILLYELTTGRQLFTGDAEYVILDKIVREDVPSPSRMMPDYPAGLERIVLQCLCRNKEQRFSTMREVQSALEDFARKQQLQLSSISLAQYMETLFAEKIRAWRDAEQNGKSLGEHLAAGLQNMTELDSHLLETVADDSDLPTKGSAPHTVPLAIKPVDAAPVSSLPNRAQSRFKRPVMLGVVGLAALGSVALLATYEKKQPALPIAPTSVHRDAEKRVFPGESPSGVKLVTTPPKPPSVALQDRSSAEPRVEKAKPAPKRRRKAKNTASHTTIQTPTAEKHLDLDAPTWR